METRQVVIGDWEGDGGIRIPVEALQEVGATSTTRCTWSRSTWARQAALCSANPRAFLVPCCLVPMKHVAQPRAG